MMDISGIQGIYRYRHEIGVSDMRSWWWLLAEIPVAKRIGEREFVSSFADMTCFSEII